MPDRPENTETALAFDLLEKFDKEGVRVPETLPQEIVTVLKVVVRDEIEKELSCRHSPRFT